MRVAVTGAGGRLGSSLVKRLKTQPAGYEVLAWDLPEHDLDDPESAGRLVSRHRPDVVIHCAAWTDVDGCARDPELAMRRNGTATGEMAVACVASGAALLVISTNEVFDGRRLDGIPYGPADEPNPGNPYGAAKLAGERAARAAFDAAEAAGTALPMAIIRTAWLFGRPGLDFPRKIVAAARSSAAEGRALGLVSDEIGCPTFAPDLASAIVDLVGEWQRPGGGGFGGIHHIVNLGKASRAEWAREILRLARIDVPTTDVPMSTWPRPSAPPAWGVLEPTPLPGGQLRPWQDATAEYVDLMASEVEVGR